MRNMSFALTTAQFRARTKTVTRRLGWRFVKVGDLLMGCVKCQGLKPNEAIERLGPIVVVAKTYEPLEAITPDDVAREGFPGMTPGEFVAMFCRHMKATPATEITRIGYDYLD